MTNFRHVIADDLALLPPLPRHADAAFAATDASRDTLRRWLPWVDGTKTADDTAAFLRDRCRAQGRKRGMTCLVEHRGEVAGTVGLNRIDPRDRAAEVGYWLADAHVGRGVMTRCVRALLSHTHGPLRLPRATVRVAVGNARSRGVPERLRLPLEATLANGMVLPNGTASDEALYASVDDSGRGDPIEFALPTANPAVSLALQQPHHARAVFALIDAERDRLGRWLRFVGRMRSRRDARGFVRRGWDGMAGEDRVQTVILLDGAVVGGIYCGGMAGVDRRGAIGYWLSQQAEGRGVMSAALRALCGHVWSAWPRVVRLQLRVSPENERSVKLAGACGFACEGRLRLDYRVAGVAGDSLLFGLPRR